MSAFHLSDFLLQAAARFPERLFLFSEEKEMTYAAAAGLVDRLAAGVIAAGVKPGDRVLIVSENRLELALTTLAAMRAGAVFSVLTSQITLASFERIVGQCEPALILLEARRADLKAACAGIKTLMIEDDFDALAQTEAVALPKPAGGDALAFLVFTSGSTGMPRGVMLSHANVEFVTQAILRRLQYRMDDRIGVFLPLSFDYGFYQLFYTMMTGAALFIGRPEMSGPELPRILARHEITIVPGVPTLFAGLIKMQSWRPVPLPRLRAFTNTGDHLPLAHIRQLRRLFPEACVFPMYGLTECKRVSIMLPEEIDAHENSVGRALDGTEVWAESPDGQRLPPGEVGEFIVQGPNVGLGYWRAPEETAKRYRTLPDGSRLLVTGDYGSVDAEGFLHFHARSDFMIKHKGHRMSPVEIEEAACRSPHIVAAGCIKDDERDKLCLFIITVPDERPEDAVILATLTETLERAKIPDRLIHLPELPRTANQKVDRKALRALLAAETA
ncbi:MAG: AMP-binding protein [Prosthecobacter sp.]|jgi:acyl-coenzyme A synthetase/AMP-(fatty) acid ligase|uniref:class I adenylate-forming enzyme family protein n=1 Tax=Prosthecobacter sp. TaxID=1965333 RepID=UPI001A0A2155|nr:AMP-binding protein [Prosthecobacter sp.]MBE2287627.1 AMP-binding protein [Prosthecobacter sp.]